jgi:hypothetical protein
LHGLCIFTFLFPQWSTLRGAEIPAPRSIASSAVKAAAALASLAKGRLMRCTARWRDKSTVSFLFEDIRDYRPRLLMQIGDRWKPAFESFQRERCSSVFSRIGERYADELPSDRLD